MIDLKLFTNGELIEKYNRNQEQGSVASEMCRRAGTDKYLLNHCFGEDRNFYSCMRDALSVLSKRPEDRW